MDELIPTSPDQPPIDQGGQIDQFVEPSRVDPMTDRTLPDSGTKLYVIFFMLIVPVLGFSIVVVLFWTLLQEFLSA